MLQGFVGMNSTGPARHKSGYLDNFYYDPSMSVTAVWFGWWIEGPIWGRQKIIFKLGARSKAPRAIKTKESEECGWISFEFYQDRDEPFVVELLRNDGELDKRQCSKVHFVSRDDDGRHVLTLSGLDGKDTLDFVQFRELAMIAPECPKPETGSKRPLSWSYNMNEEYADALRQLRIKQGLFGE